MALGLAQSPGPHHTTLTRGGYGCGIEMPFMAKAWLATNAEPDIAKRIEISNAVADFLFDEAVSVGVVGVPNPITYNPNSIADWPMDPVLFTGVNGYENIVPK